MKSIFLFFIITVWSLTTFGQSIVDVSKTQKITKNGVEVINFQGKPLSGFLIENYLNGKPKSWITLHDGITNGLWQEWYENGKLKFNAYWLDGKGHGPWEYYHDNGVLRQEEFYNLDIPIGIFRVFYDNGQLKEKTSWLNGMRHGIWNYYNEVGALLKTEIYNDNKLISTTEK